MYKKKYLKYKMKYLNLKKKIGGAIGSNGYVDLDSLTNPNEGKLVEESIIVFHFSHKKNRESILEYGLKSPFNLGGTTGLNAPEEDEMEGELSNKIYFSEYKDFEAYNILEEKSAVYYILEEGESFDDLDIWILKDSDFLNQHLRYGRWYEEYYIQQDTSGPYFGDLLELANSYQRWELGIGDDLMGYLKEDDYNYYGYNEDGYNRNGFDKDGFDVYGYDEDGYDEYGYDKDGYDKNGYNTDGYDQYGYNEEGYDEEGNFRDSFYDNDIYSSDEYDEL